MQTLEYFTDGNVSPREVEALFDAADFPGRGGRFDIDDITKMLARADIVVTARSGETLAGIALSLSNYVSVCYLAAFAVHPNFQKNGIGAELIHRSHAAAGGDRLSLVSVSTPQAVGFYEKIGMERCHNGFILPRRRNQ